MTQAAKLARIARITGSTIQEVESLDKRARSVLRKPIAQCNSADLQALADDAYRSAAIAESEGAILADAASGRISISDAVGKLNKLDG